MFKKILIANRGEIALRVIRTAREMGIKTVVVYSQADEQSLPVLLADESVCVGPAASNASYLNIPNILSAALMTGAEAIHPGYGFMAENPDFAEMCREHGIVFIGPTPESMRELGSKAGGREIAANSNVPVVPGTGVLEGTDEALLAAKQIGYPVLLKASAGGGGRGQKIVRTQEELKAAFGQAQEEARLYFGDPAIIMEKFLEEFRHVEVQVMGDGQGHVIHIGERDCSIQRHRFGMAEALSEVHADVVYGDVIFGLGIDYPLRSISALRRVAGLVLPVVTKLPQDWFYPTGEKQEVSVVSKGTRYYAWADVLAGDTHYVKRYAPQDLGGKTVLTQTITGPDRDWMTQHGVKRLITTTPRIGSRNFATNVMEAMFVALAGKKEALSEAEYLDWIRKVDFRPQVNEL